MRPKFEKSHNRKRFSILFTLIIAGLINGCDINVNVVYNNSHDPQSPIYQPAQLETLDATMIGDTAIILDWTDSSPTIDGFYVERSIGSIWSSTRIGTVPAGTYKYVDSLVPNQRSTYYYYRVCAYKKQIQGDYVTTEVYVP